MELEDGYVLMHKQFIGSGRHSRVFYGTHKQSLNKKVAIKLFKDHNAYQKELYILKHLHNKANVPIVLSSGSISILKYIVIPKYDITLHDFIKNNGIIELNNALYLFYELVVCLEEIHSNGIVHRDIKPMNIMLHKESIFIIDFSLAAPFTEDLLCNSVVGSPIFMSINAHKRGLKNYTYRDDLESLYYTFLYCIYGQLPWSDTLITHTKKRAFEEIEAQKMNFKCKYDYLCKSYNHEDIIQQIEEYYINNNNVLENEKKNFYEKIALKNSHIII